MNAGYSGGVAGAVNGFINLNAVMTASDTAKLVMAYRTGMDVSTVTVNGVATSSPPYGTPFGGINPLYDPAAGTFIGRIDFVNTNINTAATALKMLFAAMLANRERSCSSECVFIRCFFGGKIERKG